MYARGMSLRNIESQVKEMYDVEMSDTLISRIIEKIKPEIEEWQKSISNWTEIISQFAIICDERLEKYL
jgi:transposase-like protein